MARGPLAFRPRVHTKNMVLGPSTSTSAKIATHNWSCLPQEIRYEIIETIIHQKSPGWSSYASVCKEWQLIVEKHNFRRLKLQPSCLGDFEDIIKQRQHLVRHIWLDVELRDHICRRNEFADWPMVQRELDYNTFLVSKGISILFSILSTWKPRAKGLALELNLHSLSDARHCDVDQEHGNRHDAQDDRENGRQVELPSNPLILDISRATKLQFGEELPQVGVVTKFIVRRQLRRWLVPSPFLKMLNKLNGLEELTFEPWRVWERGWSTLNDRQWAHSLAKNLLPQSLKKLTLFENFREDLAEAMGQGNGHPLGRQTNVHPKRIVDPTVGALFAARSLNLEHLSVAYMIDARDFFQACDSAWTWERLESLTLTSQLLRHHEESKFRKQINALLHTAGMAALRMPKLHTLVLWNGTKGSAFAFIYRVDRGAAYLNYRATWELTEEISSKVVELWEHVALESHSCFLRVAKLSLISSSVIGSHGEAIHHLDLPYQVVAPASLWRIRREYKG